MADITTVLDPLVDALSELVLCSITGVMTSVKQCAGAIAQNTNQLVKVAHAVSSASTNLVLQNEMVAAIERVTDSMQVLVAEFMNIIKNRGEKERDSFAGAARNVGEAISAVIMLTDETARDELNNCLKIAGAAAKSLYDAATGNEQDFPESAERFSETSKTLINVTVNTAETTVVPEKRGLLLSAYAHLEQSTKQFEEAAVRCFEAAGADQEQQALAQALLTLHEGYKLVTEAAKLKPPSFLVALDPQQDFLEKKIGEVGKLLEFAANQTYNAARNARLEELVEATQNVAKFALQVTHLAEETWQAIEHPEHKAELRGLIDELWRRSNELVDAAGEVSGQISAPSQQALTVLGQSRDHLIAALKKLLVVERKTPPPLSVPAAVQEARNNALEEENKAALFRLARDEVATAMLIADEGEKIAKRLPSMEKRSHAFQSLTNLRMGGEKVLKVAKAAASAPEDTAAQQSLAGAQKELADNVRVVFRAVGADSEEAQQSLKMVDAALGEVVNIEFAEKVFAAARDVLGEIAQAFPKDGPSAQVQEIMTRAREVCAKSANLVTNIRALVRETKVQDLKNSLGTAAKLLNDRAIRIKIISIVKLSAGQDNDDVSIAVGGLAGEVINIVSSLKAELLRLKLTTAVNQATAMKNALGVIRSHAAAAH